MKRENSDETAYLKNLFSLYRYDIISAYKASLENGEKVENTEFYKLLSRKRDGATKNLKKYSRKKQLDALELVTAELETKDDTEMSFDTYDRDDDI